MEGSRKREEDLVGEARWVWGEGGCIFVSF